MHVKGEWKIHVTLNVAVNQDKNKYKSSSDPRKVNLPSLLFLKMAKLCGSNFTNVTKMTVQDDTRKLSVRRFI